MNSETVHTPPPETATGEVWLLLDSRGIGGIESHVLALAGALRAAGRPTRVVFLADHGRHPLHPTLAVAGIPCTTLTGSYAGLSRILATRRPALLHTHGYKAGLLGRVAARRQRIPVVSTYHSGDPGRGRVRLYDWLDRMTSRLAPAVAVSREIASRLYGPATVIPNFVAAAPVRDTEVGAARGPIGRVAFVGRLSEEKDPAAFCELAARHPGTAFEIYGDGPLRAGLEARHGRVVQFHGNVDDMAARWCDIGLLVMPSRYEGLPMAALEALAHGVPVAAYAVGALPELLADSRNGWLAAPGDLEALDAAIDRWRGLTAGARDALSECARTTVTEHYSPAARLPSLLGVYAQAAGTTA